MKFITQGFQKLQTNKRQTDGQTDRWTCAWTDIRIDRHVYMNRRTDTNQISSVQLNGSLLDLVVIGRELTVNDNKKKQITLYVLMGAPNHCYICCNSL